VAGLSTVPVLFPQATYLHQQFLFLHNIAYHGDRRRARDRRLRETGTERSSTLSHFSPLPPAGDETVITASSAMSGDAVVPSAPPGAAAAHPVTVLAASATAAACLATVSVAPVTASVSSSAADSPPAAVVAPQPQQWLPSHSSVSSSCSTNFYSQSL
jgi:hypothetical protein